MFTTIIGLLMQFSITLTGTLNAYQSGQDDGAHDLCQEIGAIWHDGDLWCEI